MYYHRKFGLSFTLFVFILSGVVQHNIAEASEEQRITICHITPSASSKEKTIQVDKPDVVDHLGHGDHIGSCNDGFLIDLNIRANRTYGVIGTVFELNTIPVTGTDYQWSISDDRSFTGDSITFSFGQIGFFQITLTSTSSNGEVEVANVGIIVHDSSDPTPNVLGLPDLLGDVNNDGQITLLDAHLTAKFSGRIASLSADEQDAADIDFSGDVTFTDASLIANAVLDGANFPNQLLSDHGMPGAVITLVSPTLQNPESLIEIGINDSLRQIPNRPIMGISVPIFSLPRN